MVIKLKKIYVPADATDGYRVLVDRLWPRGISKETAAIDQWLKEVAPSTQLRKWFNHDLKKWSVFKKKYAAELKDLEAFDILRNLSKTHKTITLVYAAKDELHNQAIVLASLLCDEK